MSEGPFRIAYPNQKLLEMLNIWAESLLKMAGKDEYLRWNTKVH